MYKKANEAHIVGMNKSGKCVGIYHSADVVPGVTQGLKCVERTTGMPSVHSPVLYASQITSYEKGLGW
jgi:hypothetical protein